jgi:DNA-binding CsgD family transcriptional regulator
MGLGESGRFAGMQEAAAILSVSRNTVRGLITNDTLEAIT